MSFALIDVVEGAPLVEALLVPGAVFAIGLWTARALDLSRDAYARYRNGSALLFGAWFVLAIIFGRAGVFGGQPSGVVPPIAIGVGLPLLAVTVALLVSPTAQRVAGAVPIWSILAAQVSRVLGAVFLVLLARGQLPAEFALPAGWGDVAIGLTAPLVARGYRADSRPWRWVAVAWNIAGVIDLVVALSTGVLTSPGALQRLALDAPNTVITTFPYVLIPTVLVPMALVLHALSLKRIFGETRFVSTTSSANDRAETAASFR